MSDPVIPSILPMVNSIQPYAWGHTHILKDFTGLTTAPSVQAELWYGSHPSCASQVLHGEEWREMTGLSYINNGKGLPYLAKLLAVESPLSIQCHPNREQAEKGYEREIREGVPPSDRNYQDSNHKPEIIYALSTFYALGGFAPFDPVAADLETLAGMLTASSRDHVETVLGLRRGSQYADLVRHVLQTPWTDDVYSALSRLAETWQPQKKRLYAKAARKYPSDPGLLFFIILDFLTLSRGEVLYTPAGVLHAYLEGFGFEVMSSSDNVLRGGLTGKRIDVDELAACIDPAADLAALTPHQVTEGQRYIPACDDFIVDIYGTQNDFFDTTMKTGTRAELFVSLGGRITIESGQDAASLEPGHSCLVPGPAASLRISGAGLLARIFSP